MWPKANKTLHQDFNLNTSIKYRLIEKRGRKAAEPIDHIQAK